MRIVTWNCRRGPFAKKTRAFAELQYDVGVVTECASPRAPDSPQRIWIQDGAKLGITVLAREPYYLESLRRVSGPPRLIAPVRVTGPLSFVLLAVWTWPEPTYHTPLHHAIDAYRALFDGGPVVVAGDFNSSSHWQKPVKGMSHATVESALKDRGLVSAYHAATGEQSGQESRYTHYHLNRQERRFHIDYCFIPQKWLGRVRSVEVGDYYKWLAFSDHRPVSVDVL